MRAREIYTCPTPAAALEAMIEQSLKSQATLLVTRVSPRRNQAWCFSVSWLEAISIAAAHKSRAK